MRNLTSVALLSAALFISACDNAEDRAQSHYDRGLELLDGGEIAKAMVEFRNALQLNQDAVAPRLEFAKLLLASGDIQGSVGNFLKVVELDPNNVEARLEVGRIMLASGNLDEARIHITAVYELAPQDPVARALKAQLAFSDDNKPEAFELARGVLAEDPGQVLATMVLGNGLIDDGRVGEVIELADISIAKHPGEIGPYLLKLRTLELHQKQEALEAHLKAMRMAFPDNQGVVQGLLQFYIQEENIDGAETTLREFATQHPDNPEYGTNFVAFIQQFRGVDAARAELETLVSTGTHKAEYSLTLARLDFSAGSPDKAISNLRELVADRSISDVDALNAKTLLADMLRRTEVHEEARQIINDVLEADAENVEGLKLRALYAIDDDRPDDAIADLRNALNVAAQDPSVLLILATAHERNGSRGLAQDRLALAVQASNAGVVESLTYASFLLEDGKFDIAEGVLTDALARNGEVPELLSGLGAVYLQRTDWARAESIAARLEAVGSEGAAQRASGLRVSILNQQKKFEGSIGLLEDLWVETGNSTAAMESLVRTYIANGQIEEAATFLDDILMDEPKNMRASLMRGAVHAFAGEAEEAEVRYRQVITEEPELEYGYAALAGFLSRQGRVDEASEVVRQGIDRSDDAPRLMFAMALRLEQQGQFEDAIGIYQELYAKNKGSDVLANNLASLLTDHRNDDESLNQAFAVAKRLRSSDNAAFQDTYGWVLFKRGEYERALQPLTVAVNNKDLSNNPIVLYHYGMVLERLGQTEKAKEALAASVAAGKGLRLPQVEQAQSVLDQLNAPQ